MNMKAMATSKPFQSTKGSVKEDWSKGKRLPSQSGENNNQGNANALSLHTNQQSLILGEMMTGTIPNPIETPLSLFESSK